MVFVKDLSNSGKKERKVKKREEKTKKKRKQTLLSKINKTGILKGGEDGNRLPKLFFFYFN